jgi:2-oxoglutarate ferredoxin oxidoreductase subunit delta
MGNLTFAERMHIPRYDDPAEIEYGIVAFDEEKCSGCGLCVKACPADTLELVNQKAGMKKLPECVACGDCIAICPDDAITLQRNFKYSGFYKTVGLGELTLPRM